MAQAAESTCKITDLLCLFCDNYYSLTIISSLHADLFLIRGTQPQRLTETLAVLGVPPGPARHRPRCSLPAEGRGGSGPARCAPAGTEPRPHPAQRAPPPNLSRLPAPALVRVLTPPARVLLLLGLGLLMRSPARYNLKKKAALIFAILCIYDPPASS